MNKLILITLYLFLLKSIAAQDTTLYYSDTINYAIIKQNYDNTGYYSVKKRVTYYEFKNSPKNINGLFIDTLIRQVWVTKDGSNEIIEIELIPEIYIVNYKNGKRHGELIHIEKGDTIERYSFAFGKLHGDVSYIISTDYCSWFDEDSNQIREPNIQVYGKYEHEKRVGVWEYYSNGKLIAKGCYNDAYIYLDVLDNKLFKIEEKDSIILINENFSGKKISQAEKIYGMRIFNGNFYLRKGRWDFYSLEGEFVKSLYYDSEGKVESEEVLSETPLRYFYCIE